MSKILILIEKRGEDVVRMQEGERPILMTNMGHKMKNRVEPKHKLIFITKILLPPQNVKIKQKQ